MSNKRYEITIIEWETIDTLTRRDWVKGGPLGRNKFDEANPDSYGYTPQVPERKVIERQVYKQNTDSLDLVKVIMSINAIGEESGE